MRRSITSRSAPTVRRLSAVVALGLALVACKHREAPAPPPPPAPATDAIPRATQPIALDGELHEPDWNLRALRGVLTASDGTQARPYSEVRFMHDGTMLLVGLYAADENIQSTDTWKLAIGPRTFTIDATGHASEADIQTGIDRDGTLDQPSDYDEEWVIEAALPLASVGTPPLAITAERCDTPKDGKQRCGRWHAQLPLQ